MPSIEDLLKVATGIDTIYKLIALLILVIFAVLLLITKDKTFNKAKIKFSIFFGILILFSVVLLTLVKNLENQPIDSKEKITSKEREYIDSSKISEAIQIGKKLRPKKPFHNLTAQPEAPVIEPDSIFQESRIKNSNKFEKIIALEGTVIYKNRLLENATVKIEELEVIKVTTDSRGEFFIEIPESKLNKYLTFQIVGENNITFKKLLRIPKDHNITIRQF